MTSLIGNRHLRWPCQEELYVTLTLQQQRAPPVDTAIIIIATTIITISL